MTGEELAMLAMPVAWNATAVRRLVDWSEQEVLKPFGVTLESYSTARLVARSQSARTKWIWQRPLISGFLFGIEELPSAFENLATDQGAALVRVSELDEEHVRTTLNSALTLIAELAPALFASVRFLLRALHVLDSRGPDFDISLTLPELPNSVFLSVPQSGERDAVSRLAEALVHEVLHLQLSLIERCCPLIRTDSNEETAYSPWRDEYRPVGGVIHGLFVFRGVESLWSNLAENRQIGASEFAGSRVEEIRGQCRRVRLAQCDSLTPFGREVLSGIAD